MSTANDIALRPKQEPDISSRWSESALKGSFKCYICGGTEAIWDSYKINYGNHFMGFDFFHEVYAEIGFFCLNCPTRYTIKSESR